MQVTAYAKTVMLAGEKTIPQNKPQSNKYEVIDQLGTGVWKVVDRKTKTPWTMKRVDRMTASGSAEVDLLTRLDHHGIPPVMDWEVDEGGIWMVYRHIKGRGLHTWIGHDLPEGQLINWAIQVAEILVYLHDQEPFPLIHRDIKPANILVDDQDHVWLIDFGAAVEGSLSALHAALPLATPYYAAPEQVFCPDQVSPRTDMYGFGMTLHRLAGDRLVRLSLPLQQVIRRAIAIQPKNRFADMREITNILKSL